MRPDQVSDADDQQRKARVQSVVSEVIRRRSKGETVSDQSLIDSHPELMPELRQELKKLQLIGAARVAVDTDHWSAETTDHADTDTGSGRLKVRCPHCHTPMELAADTLLTDLTCESCGSHFSLVDNSQTTRTAEALTTMGRFELLERLGLGGFGTVWKARDTELDRSVAVKIPRQGDMSPEETEKFLREARAAAQLRHPNIVSVHEVGRDGDSVYIVSDFVRGVNLADWLTGQQLTSREASELCIKLAEALHHAHEHRVIHRDLKPANIMMDASGEPHLMDFGLARREVGEVTMTMDGQVLGTPAYMSPEQAQGEAHTADRRSDVYSLGVILFQLLTGELPFRGNARMLLHQVLHEEAPSPRKLNANIPRDLETICLKCLEKEPALRYHTSQRVADELQRFLRHKPIQSRPMNRVGRSLRWCKRNPQTAALSTLLALALAVGSIASTVFAIRAGREAERANFAVQAERVVQDELRERLYRADMLAAYTAWDFGNVERTYQLLDEHRPVSEQKDQRRFEWYLLRKLCLPDALALKPSDADTNPLDACALAVSPNGTLLASGTKSGAVILWDPILGREVKRLQKHSNTVKAVAFSPDGMLLASCSLDNSVIVWDVVSGNPQWTFEGHATPLTKARGGNVRAVAFSPDGTMIASGGADETARLWNVADGKLIATLEGHTDIVTSMVFYLDGKTLATGSMDDSLRLWNLPGGEQKVRHQQPSNVWALALSPDGKTLAVAHRLYDLEADKKFVRLQSEHAGGIYGTQFSPDGKLLATTSSDQTIKIWDTTTGRLLDTLRGHRSVVAGIAFIQDTQRLASVGYDNTLRIWSLDDWARSRLFVGENQYIPSCVTFSPDGQLLASVSSRGEGGIWNVDSGTEVCRLDTKGQVLAMSPDGKRLAVGWDSGKVQLRKVPTGEKLSSFRDHVTAVRAMDFSPDGKHLATASEDGKLLIRDLSTGNIISSVSDLYGRHRALKFLLDGITIAWADDDTIKIANVTTGEITEELTGHDDLVISLAVSPDGRTLAAGSKYGSIKLWDISGTVPKLHTDLRDSTQHVYSLAFSPDGRILVSGNQDRKIRFWDVATGDKTGAITNDLGEILSLAFSSDGVSLAAGSSDGTVRLWHAEHSSD